MVNLLVVDDNFYYSKNLINIIASQNPKVRLCNFCTDGKDVLDLLSNQQYDIDIILLDLKLPNYNGIDILDYIEKNKIEKYKDSIIIVSGEMELMLKVRKNPYLYTSINKTSGFDRILRELNDLVEMKEQEKNSIEYKIHNELNKLHYNFSYIGTKYLAEALLIYNNSDFININLEKDIYPIIAKKYKKSVNNIKTNIINATALMYYDCKEEILEHYFGIVAGEKPTPKMIIATILNHLKYN